MTSLAQQLVLASLTFGTGYIAYWYYNWQKKVRSGKFPSKPPSFPLGNISELAGDIMKGLDRIASYAGDEGIASIWLGSKEGFVITHHEDIKTLIRETYRAGGPSTHIDHFLGSKSMVRLNHDEWKFHRRLVGKAFEYAHIIEMVGDILNVYKELENYLDHHQDVDMDIFPILKVTTLEAIGVTAFGYKFGAIQGIEKGPNPVGQAFEFLLSEMTRRNWSVNPLKNWYWLPLQANRDQKAASNLVRGEIQKMIDFRKQTSSQAESSHKDFLTLLLESKDEEDPTKTFTDKELSDEVMTLLFGGHDTSSIALTYAVYLLSTNPQVEKKIIDEINTVLGTDDLVFEHISKLTYTANVIKESLRLFPPAPVTSRTAENAMKIRGKDIPALSLLMFPISLIHRTEYNFPRANECVPERYEEEYNAAAWLPFSGGTRDCIGRRFAMMEMTILLALLYRRYRFELIPGQVIEPKMMGVVQNPAHGVHVKVYRR